MFVCVRVCVHTCTCMYVWRCGGGEGEEEGSKQGKKRHDINNSRGL